MPGFEVPAFGFRSLRKERLGAAPKIVLLWLLRGYQRILSPWFLPSCRYVPTCSEYAIEAIERFGAVRGLAMAIWRLLRCHPFVRGGFDPVPDRAGAEIFRRTRVSGTTRSGVAQVGVAPASDVCSHTTH